MKFEVHSSAIWIMCILPHLTVCAEKHRLIIVGAGPAGIAAATRLVSNGFEDFLILEAENRIGGRVHNIPYDENITVDLGAQLIFGQKGNVVYEMANEFNLVYTECPDYVKSFINVNSTGVQMDTDEASRMMRLLNVVIHEHMENHNGSLGQYVHERGSFPKRCFLLLKAFRFFPGAKSTIPEPARILTTSWGSNKHFRGSYSIRTLTTERLNTSAAELGAPVSNGMGKPAISST
ncbi:polyamine oxidase FMS1 [Diaphorina citri]|uniref:Polyamine oxidase FMS1 n=1 Tax=Diaphorina citri TaxID=121845 RepID=A0A3Q0JDU8_DIACI|nr:polyamine oxidase FMS1 [Diaphorina citri]